MHRRVKCAHLYKDIDMNKTIQLFRAIRRHDKASKNAKAMHVKFICTLEEAKQAKRELDRLLKEREFGTSTITNVSNDAEC